MIIDPDGEVISKIISRDYGNMSNKEDTLIQILAKEAIKKGYQVLSFDLPEHGERKNDSTPCKVQFCVNELSIIMNYAEHWKEVSLFACSMGAYFSLLAYRLTNSNLSYYKARYILMEEIK